MSLFMPVMFRTVVLCFYNHLKVINALALGLRYPVLYALYEVGKMVYQSNTASFVCCKVKSDFAACFGLNCKPSSGKLK